MKLFAVSTVPLVSRRLRRLPFLSGSIYTTEVLKKREEERNLGIDEETRDILGLNDTDSDESESEPSEGENEVSSSENESEEEWSGIWGDGVDGEEESEEGDDGEGPRHVVFQIFTAQQALDEPIYAHPTQNKAQLCAICPGKSLIHPLAIPQHLASKAHERRSRHIGELASLPEHADSSLIDLMQLMEGGSRPGFQPPDGQAGEGTSKRAEKKRKAVEIRKARREKKKTRKQEKEEKQKAEEEKHRAARSDQMAPVAAFSTQSTGPSAKKDKSKDKLKAESAKTAQTKQPEPSTKKAAEKATIAKPKERGHQKPPKAPAAALSAQSTAYSAKKDKSKDKLEAKTARAKQPEPPTKQVAEKATAAKPKERHNDKKRKKGVEKETGFVVTADSHSPVKKRKTDDEDILREEVAQQIKDIAKSATTRAHLAQSKAKQNDGEGKPKPKKGNKST